ncbi:MAG: YqgE/AlgH family protein [Solirubrobacterales bacterium]
MEESLSGQLLVAAPSLLDPNFRRTVVLVGAHSEEGAMGVVLNRPSEVTVGEAVPQLEQAIGELETVYVGGPVQPSSIVFLAEFLDPSPAGLLVLGRIGFPAPEADIDELSDAIARRRVFAGYAGWGEGQLDEELDQGDWIAQPARPEDVFTQDPDELWSKVLARKGGAYALMARMPLDPSVN